MLGGTDPLHCLCDFARGGEIDLVALLEPDLQTGDIAALNRGAQLIDKGRHIVDLRRRDQI